MSRNGTNAQLYFCFKIIWHVDSLWIILMTALTCTKHIEQAHELWGKFIEVHFSPPGLSPLCHVTLFIANIIHYSGDIMSPMASQITGASIVCSTVWFRRRSKRTAKLRVTGLCEGNSPVTGEFPAQRASNAENASIWWCHHHFETTCSSRHCFHSMAIDVVSWLYGVDAVLWQKHVQRRFHIIIFDIPVSVSISSGYSFMWETRPMPFWHSYLCIY